MAKNRLKEFGFIAFLIERFFRFLQFLPPWILLSNRADHQKSFTDENRIAKAKERAVKIDAYILIFVLFEIFLIVLISSIYSDSRLTKYLGLTIGILRIIDIIQVNVNMVLFDHLRIRKQEHYMVSAVRTIIFSFINFFELILCFGFIYHFNHQLIIDYSSWLDAFYLSLNSQMGVKLADILPKYWNKLIFTIQSFVGFFFGLLIFARVIAILPKIKAILEQDN